MVTSKLERLNGRLSSEPPGARPGGMSGESGTPSRYTCGGPPPTHRDDCSKYIEEARPAFVITLGSLAITLASGRPSFARSTLSVRK
jgi:hypothetical protein